MRRLAVLALSVPMLLNCRILQADLVALWDFDCFSLTDSWADNDGTGEGYPDFADGRPGKGRALELTGGNYVEIAAEWNFDITRALSVAVWIQVRSFDKEWQAIVTKGNSAWRIQRNSLTDAVEFACSGLRISGRDQGDEWGNLFGQQNVNDGQWHHVAGVYDGRRMYLYIDGVLDVSQAATGLVGVNDHPVCIGENAEQPQRHFVGMIDEVAVFDHALESDEVARLFTQGAAAFVPDTYMTEMVRSVENAVSVLEAPEAVRAVEEKIAAYRVWRQDHQRGIPFRDQYLSPDVHCLLAQARKRAGMPLAQVASAYRDALSLTPYRTRHVPAAMLWLCDNSAADEFVEEVRRFTSGDRVLPYDVHGLAQQFAASGPWESFERFLDGFFSTTDFTGETTHGYARAIAAGLEGNEAWMRRFMDYCRARPGFTDYLFLKERKQARKYLSEKNYRSAAAAYGDVASRCSHIRDRARYDFQRCECLFHAQDYVGAISGLRKFINDYRPHDWFLVSRAMMLEGQSLVSTGQIEEALDAFVDLLIEYPDADHVVEAHFFVAYCHMLRGRFPEAKEMFEFIATEYPKSGYAPKSRAHIARIESIMQ